MGVVPLECHLWEFMACRVHKVPEGGGGGVARPPGGQGYDFDGHFPDIRKPCNAFEHIMNKRNDLDQSYGHVWPTTWVQITLASRERILLPVYFALYVFKDNEVAVRVIEKAVVSDAYRIMGSVISNGIDFGGGVSTVTLEDGTEKRYRKEKLDIPELQELRDLAYRQKQELEHEVLVERPRRIAEAERQEEEKKDHWYREQQRLGQDRRPRAPDTPRVQAMKEQLDMSIGIQNTLDPRERRDRELQGPYYGALTKGGGKQQYMAKRRRDLKAEEKKTKQNTSNMGR